MTYTPRAIVALSLVALLAGGCRNPFKPASAERPSGDSRTVLENYDLPDSVLATMGRAFAAKADGGQAYASCFAESVSTSTRAFYAFHAQAAIDVWQQGGAGRTPPNPWDLTLERNFFAYFVSNVAPLSSFDLVWSADATSPNDDFDPVAGTALLHRKYVMLAEGTTTQTVVTGYADLYLYRGPGGRWYLYRWQDRIDPDVGPNPGDTRLSMGARRLESS